MTATDPTPRANIGAKAANAVLWNYASFASGKVLVPDYDYLTNVQLAALQEQLEAEYEARMEREAERRMGC